jgi:hypothetical protein
MKSYQEFKFVSYELNQASQTLTLTYAYDNELTFTEVLQWNKPFSETPDVNALDQALRLLHITLGISYAKAYLAPKLTVPYMLTKAQTIFFNTLYKNGLGEFLYMNDLEFSRVPTFSSDSFEPSSSPAAHVRPGIILPMSGGKDSLLTASILKKADKQFTPFFVTTDGNHPAVIDEFGEPLLVTRTIDSQLFVENELGAYNGHVPFSAILGALLVFSSLMYGASDIILSQESSADESTTVYKGESVNHQYSKSSAFEDAMSTYVHQSVSSEIRYFSLLRSLGEQDIHRLFVSSGLFEAFKGMWSSCNRANYKQGNNTSTLRWCGECSKCLNAFILFAPFLEKQALLTMFNNQNLLKEPARKPIINDLLGVSNAKPFECVAEVNELRGAIRSAYASGGWDELQPFVLDDKVTTSHQTLPTAPVEYQTILEAFLEKQQA